MRILIDLQGAQSKSRFRGIGRYSLSLTKALIKNGVEHEIFIALSALFPETIDELTETFSSLIPPHRIVIFHGVGPVDELSPQNTWRLRASEAIREKFMSDLKPDILLVTSLFEGATDNTVATIKSLFPSTPTAVILYDLIPLMNPERYIAWEPLKNWYYRKIESLKRADLLLGISESASEEARVHLGIENASIVTISSAADEMFDAVQIEDAHLRKIRKRYGISRPYLMHSGAYEPRKNFEGLIEAFASLPETLRSHYQLVLVCRLDEGSRAQLTRAAVNAGLKPDEIILTGHISDSELIALYALAHLFVFPSLHEGFGLPILEAMACGTPVIGSNTSSIPEVIGRDDALFDPASIPDIARMLEKTLTNEKFYADLCAHAALQHRRFSWDNTARVAIKAFESFERQSPPPDTSLGYDTLIRFIGELDFPSDHDDWVAAAVSIDKNEKHVSRASLFNRSIDKMIWRIEGPFDSTYSLALLNRETARALDNMGHTVILHSTEGPGDFPANPHFLEANPDLARLHERVAHYPHESVDVVSRNLYPPRVRDMNAPLNLLHHYAWEESAFPPEWAGDFNASLEGITCLSHHVEKILIDAGVHIPLATSGCGVDHWQRVLPDTLFPLQAKTFRFLHVSSCFPRKGVDDLLEAYGRSFTASDDVTLIIKTFKNPHNHLTEWLTLTRERFPSYPHVIVIEEDLTDSALKALYLRSHALVAPSRAEGYGLPMAEAMLSGLPVITTGWGGQLDFCDDQNSYLVDYTFEKAQTHFNLSYSVWARVDIDHLSSTMRRVFETPLTDLRAKAALGAERLLSEHTWHMASSRLESFVHTLRTPHSSTTSTRYQKNKIAWISSYNTKCGIASYSHHLLSSIPNKQIAVFAPYTSDPLAEDQESTFRCWNAAKEQNDFESLTRSIERFAPQTLVVQFNYGFFDFTTFGTFLHDQIDSAKTVLVVLHSTSDPFGETPNWRLSEIAEPLSRCDRILVHSIHDLNRLKALGLIDNVTLFPLGYSPLPIREKTPDPQPLIATYGFALPHKGLSELIEAMSILKSRGLNLRLRCVTAAYPDPSSHNLIASLREHIETLSLSEQVTLITDYLQEEESFAALSDADLIILAYQHTGESSSAAVRFALSTARPVALTPLSIFDDIASSAFLFAGTTPSDIASGIELALSDIVASTHRAHTIEKNAALWRERHTYDALGIRLGGIIDALQASKM